MKSIRFVYQMLAPSSALEIALSRTQFAAVTINAVSGMVLLAAPAMLMFLISASTISLSACLIILFGPLFGFLCSSIYSRLEWFIGMKLGGKASLDDLYRVFAWSFLPLTLWLMGCLLLCFSVAKLDLTYETETMIAISIPFLIMSYFSLRNYGANVIVVQQFTRARGAVGILITLVLALTMTFVTIVLLWLFAAYGTSQNMKMMLG
jgi:hypothetical protein